ncbi:unnamed protein product [Urochloa humidicola]
MPQFCFLSVLPQWIGQLRLLSILKIEVMGVSGSNIVILEQLPALTALSLYVRTAPAKRIIFRREGFPVLMQFKFICSALCIAFEEGTMPNVRSLRVGFNASSTGKQSISETGLENLTGLEVFSAKIGGAGADEFSGNSVKSMLEDIFCRNLSPPIINIQFVSWVIYGAYIESIETSAAQQIAKEGSTEDMVTHLHDPAFCNDEKEISTAPAAQQMSEGDDSTEGITTDLRDLAFAYGSKEISTTCETQQIARDMATDLQDLAISHCDEDEKSATWETQQIADLRDLSFTYDDDQSSTVSAMWPIIEEEGSPEDLRGPSFPHGLDREINTSSSPTQETAKKIIPVSRAEDAGDGYKIWSPAPSPSPSPSPKGRHKTLLSSASRRVRPPPRPEDHTARVGCVGRMVSPLLSLSCRVRRPTVHRDGGIRRPVVYGDGLGRDGLLWWRGLAGCHAGHVSIATVQANNPMEDHCCVESSHILGTAIGVFDGHGGPEAAIFACDHLFSNLQKACSGANNGMTEDAISKAFLDTEEGFLAKVSRTWEEEPQIATVGTCCLVGIVHRGTLFVANLGISRAVLGKKIGPSGQVAAEQLSSEHDVGYEAVRQELSAQHPDDPKIVARKKNVWRVKGLVPFSRSIGDAYLKHVEYNSERIHSKFRLRKKFSRPLLSSSPSIISRKVQPDDRFVIFASHGLWVHLSNQEAVGIVDNHQPAGSARRLVEAATLNAAKKHKIRYSDLKQIETGVRAHFHDDITAIVLFLSDDGQLVEGAHQELSIRSPHN